ncbi:uncharacterized protein NPIL_154661 [Nephila pilipes]|uniref:Mutator-like transposase domain-containing protein n=1 Tax=Nephila pilipes TaxID=299642 RepID=A0A8X6NA52_NEPPI|nr:uncharacterized protein NPIL_154661 [Nephila pilipes]
MSSGITNGFDDINIRLAYGMRCIRKVNSTEKTFYAIMNLPPPSAKFERYNDVLLRSLTATCLETGKDCTIWTVQDCGWWYFEYLRKYCFKCKNRSNEDHTYEKNFEGFSGRMESYSILKIFQRSERLSNVRYENYFGVGDSKAFNTISKTKVYGDDVEVKQLECIGHLQK